MGYPYFNQTQIICSSFANTQQILYGICVQFIYSLTTFATVKNSSVKCSFNYFSHNTKWKMFNRGFLTAIGSEHRSKINVLVTMWVNIFPQRNGCFVLVIAVYNHAFRFICVYHHSMSVTVIIQQCSVLSSSLFLLVARITVSSKSIQICNQFKNPSLPHFCLNIVIMVSTNKLNKKYAVGDPCLTPIIAVTMAIPRILLVTLWLQWQIT